MTNRIFSDFKKNDPLKLTASLSKSTSTGPVTGSLTIEVQGQPYVYEIQKFSLANDGSSFSKDLVKPIVKTSTRSFKPAKKAIIQPLIAAFQNGNSVSADLTVKGIRITGTATITNGVKTTPQPVDETIAGLASIKGFGELLNAALVALLKEGATVVP